MRLEHHDSGRALTVAGRSASYLPGAPISPTIGESRFLAGLRRTLWMSLLGGFSGAVVAAIACLLQPPIYRTTARVQMVDLASLRGMGRVQTNAEYGSPLSDEVLVVRSAQVLQDAARLGELDWTIPFSDMSPSEIAATLNADRALVVEPAVENQATSVIRIQYDAPDPATSQRVVDAIMEAYSRHTEAKFEKKDGQVVAQVLSARDDALTELRDLERLHDEFKLQTDLVFVDGRPQSVHRKTADRYQAQKQELLVAKAEIESQLHAAERSLSRGEAANTVMLALRGETETASDVIDQGLSRQLQQLQNELRDRASVRVRETELLPLQLEREDLLEKFGSSHPTVRSIDQQISVVEAQIGRLEAEEADKERLIQKVMSIGNESEGEEALDPEKEARKRVDLAIDALRQRLDSIQQQINIVNEAYDFESEKAKEEIAAIRESDRFERDIARQAEIYEKILSRLDDVKLTTGNEGLRVMPLDEAQPGQPVMRPILPWTGIGGMIGLVMGSLLAILLPTRQRAYHSSVDVATHLQMPVLGHVPLLTNRDAEQSAGAIEDRRTHPKLCTVHSPYSRAAEGFNAIRTALLFSDAASGNRILQITSAAPGAGKSTVAANLAVSIARAGKKVLLVDADLRRPNIQGLFNLPDARGLGWLLETASSGVDRQLIENHVKEVIQTGPVPNLSLLIAGTTRENPSELLSSDSVTVLLDVWRQMFDLVLIDSPPLLAVTDPSTLAPRVDAVLLVVRAEGDNMTPAARAADMLGTLNANVVGVIVNGVDEQGGKGYRIYPTQGSLRIGSGSTRQGAGYSYGSGDFQEYYGPQK